MQAILLINVAVYLLSLVYAKNLLIFGAFVPDKAYEFWRFLSYAFIHQDFWHVLFNMLMFWMFAIEVCRTLGEKNFTALYLSSVICSVLFSLPFYIFEIIGHSGVYIIGASGALFGIMMAYAFLFPERMILMFFIIPMKIKHAIWIFVAISLFMARSNDGIAHFAHLGGIISGYLFMQIWSRPQKQKTYSKKFFRERAEQYKSNSPLEGEERLNENKEKINRSGLQSLNQQERDYLQWFGQQNKRRG
jgi:membrane associated rhomboid family serine protease